MEPTLFDNTKRFTKEELRDANCCRFCGVRAHTQDPYAISFVPIFEKCELSQKLIGGLDVLINRYLPIKVFQDDPYYPRFICSTCYYALEETIGFFNKILEGQRLLANIINRTGPNVQPQFDLIYSEDNPVAHLPRRRGRPKRDPNQPKNVKPKDPVIESSILFDGKRKRTIKPPIRFGQAYVDPFLAVVKQEVEDLGNSQVSIVEFSAPVLIQGNLLKSEQRVHGIQSELTSLSHHGENPLMELVKLNVMMDGDEEELENIQIHTTILEGNVNIQADENTVFPIDEIVEEHVMEPENCDSDTSVKTIDFVQNKARKKKRGKKRKGRYNSKKKKQIHCPDPNCDKIFNYTSSLNYHHQRVHVKTIQCNCTVCGRGFTHEKLLKFHMFSHSEEKKFKCIDCIAKFKTRASLYTHQKTVHLKSKEHKCETCGQLFRIKSSLKAHSLLHSGTKPFTCDYCGKAFAQDSNLKAHVRIHTGDRPHKCDIEPCEKAFITSTQLRIHKMTHLGGKPHLCAECGKSFASKDSFKYHLMKHTGEKPFSCTACNRTFTTPWAFKRHSRLHTDEKPYQCSRCGKSFADLSNLSKHKKTHDSEIEGVVVDSLQDVAQFQLDTIINEECTEQGQVISHVEISTSEQGENEELVTIDGSGPIVQILNADNLLDGTEQDGQVIYVYPEDLSLLTITLEDPNQAEAQSNDENTLQVYENLTTGPITFTTMEQNPDLTRQYFSIGGESDGEDISTEIRMVDSVLPHQEIKFVLQDSNSTLLVPTTIDLDISTGSLETSNN